MTNREQKITFGEMRESGVRSVVIYCSDYRCTHSTTALTDGWPDDVRLSDIEDRFVCKACGRRGDVRPLFGQAPMGTDRNKWLKKKRRCIRSEPGTFLS